MGKPKKIEPDSGRDMVGQNPTGNARKSSAGKRRQEANRDNDRK
jgi:hypothetical protein